MSATGSLAGYISSLKYADLPPSVVEKGKLLIMDAVGNAIAGYPFSLSKSFLELAKNVGGGSGEATLIGDGAKVSIPFAAFGNQALAYMLDYTGTGGHIGVPAALAAGEAKGISGKDLITSVVAGYECQARISSSMDEALPQDRSIQGVNLWVFAAAGAAARALGLDEDEMLSAIGMTGIYTCVPAGYKWMGDEGLSPRRDIKQGAAWICMSGAFAAVSAQKGLKMLQPNNILDGDKGLWQMLGKQAFREEELTAGFGETYHILEATAKYWSGCAVTHPAMTGITRLVRDHGISPDEVERIEVVTNRPLGIGFEDQAPEGAFDLQFSVPYQVSAALVGGDRGPDWYLDKVAKSPEVTDMAKRVFLSFDEDSDKDLREGKLFTAKVAVLTKQGRRYNTYVDEWELARNTKEFRDKFITITSQVIDRRQIDAVLDTIENLETLGTVSALIDQLTIPHPSTSSG